MASAAVPATSTVLSPSTALTGAQIREAFLQFFAGQHGHKRMASASLIPSNPTVLLTPAGMLPFVPIFLGVEPAPTPPRATSSQKCARVSGKASDLENVGRTPQHHTFFEMRGNFSFGDYFKTEAISMAWAFLTEVLQIPAERLWISVLKTDTLFDEESYQIWQKKVGVSPDRILFRDEKDNFWGPPGPTGPCGPCSEIYYDWEPGGPSPLDVEGLIDTPRFMEVWNLVFMELFQDSDGKRTPLARKNIDTGMGLERITRVVQQTKDTFDTDLLSPLVTAAKALTTIATPTPDQHVALKILADHARFAAFAVADGVIPSNEGRGYILRMIIRRAVRYGRQQLGLSDPQFHRLMATVVAEYGPAYPELLQHAEKCTRVVLNEETQFLQLIERGMDRLDELMAAAKAAKQKQLSGDDVFKLYDTYGFPREITLDIAQEQGLTIDEDGFEAAMAAQRTRAREGRKGVAIVDNQVYSDLVAAHGATTFVGYETLEATATVKALLLDGQPVTEVRGTNQPFEVILETTPFYAESGGQVGDRGTLSQGEGHHGITVVINDTQKKGELVTHSALFDNGGEIRVGDVVLAQVEPVYRQLSAIHHSATHLLHAALIKVLGADVAQAGSYVSPEGARFDFTFPRAVAADELNRVEYWVNTWVRENHARVTRLTDVDSARAAGAIAMFGEKYADEVRAVQFGHTSHELCGGTDVDYLGEIGLIKITSEGSVAAGVRRVEFVAGDTAYKLFKQSEALLGSLAYTLKSPVRDVLAKVDHLLASQKALQKTVQRLQDEAVLTRLPDLLSTLLAQGGWLVDAIPNASPEGLKTLAEALRDKCPNSFVLLGAADGEKVAFYAVSSESWIAQGFGAGQWVKTAAQTCDGNGGGKPQFAQAGGKNPDALPEAIAVVRAALQQVVQA